jgi:hypothetical protein
MEHAYRDACQATRWLRQAGALFFIATISFLISEIPGRAEPPYQFIPFGTEVSLQNQTESSVMNFLKCNIGYTTANIIMGYSINERFVGCNPSVAAATIESANGQGASAIWCRNKFTFNGAQPFTRSIFRNRQACPIIIWWSGNNRILIIESQIYCRLLARVLEKNIKANCFSFLQWGAEGCTEYRNPRALASASSYFVSYQRTDSDDCQDNCGNCNVMICSKVSKSVKHWTAYAVIVLTGVGMFFSLALPRLSTIGACVILGLGLYYILWWAWY